MWVKKQIGYTDPRPTRCSVSAAHLHWMIHVLFVILLVASLSSDLLVPSSAQLDNVVATFPPILLPYDVAIIDDDGDEDDKDDSVIFVGSPLHRECGRGGGG
jgi:hypothetical protein